MRDGNRRSIGCGTLVRAALLACACAIVHRIAVAGEFMFMPTAAVIHPTGSNDDPTLEKRQTLADLFYAVDRGRLRFLGELQLERDGWDMERLQVGWRVTPNASVWLGRYHNPIGYWNIEHHHGHYMETSAERPRILEFEDEGGPLPIHLAGLLVQGTHALGESSLHYDIGIATGPRVVDGELEPVDVIRSPRRNKLATVARLAYRPDAGGDNQVGVFAARTRIPVEGADPSVVNQDLWGMYASQDWGRLRIFGELFRVRHRTAAGGPVDWPSYWAGYLQAEYKLVPSVWTLFARHEGLSSRLTDAYTELFPKLPNERQVAGVRWDFIDNQALKLEFVRDKTTAGMTFNGIELQWSAMFP
jgi:hypothetical protein